jgi:mannose-6-phosphate isomerase-like protein (cupin superfamily)
LQLAELRIDGWSTVINVHGAAGNSGWQQLCPGFARHGPWEAVEAARLPPGGVSGVHRHSRTNEIYFVLAGAGILTLDDQEIPVRAQHLAVTRIGGKHGLRNTTRGELTWLVVEAPAPASALRQYQAGKSGGAMAHSFGPFDMAQLGHVDFAQYDVSPLAEAGLIRLETGESIELAAEGRELFSYLLNGSAVLRCEGVEYPIESDTGFTMTLAEHTTLFARQACELFWLACSIQQRGEAQ